MFCRLHQKITSTQFQRLLSILVDRTVISNQPFSAVCPSYAKTKIQFSNFCTNNNKNINNDLISSSDVVVPQNNLNLDDTFHPNVYEIMVILNCKFLEASKLYNDLLTLNEKTDKIDLRTIKKTLNWLKRIGATLEGILTNPDILLISIDILRKRNERLIISKWKTTDDYIPFLTVDENKIRDIQFHRPHVILNRIYLLSECIPSVAPYIISHYSSKHMFLFEIEFELLKRKLNILLNSNISPMNIMRDLDVLARSEKKIQERLAFLETCDVKRIMPWMLKCEKKILTRTIEGRRSRNREQNQVVELLADRLDLHCATAKSIYQKNKFLHGLNSDALIAASKLIDKLLEVFSREEIASNVSLLSEPLPQLKIRIAELGALKSDTTFISPNVLRMSRKKFDLFLNEAKNK